jgi:DNA-binding FadR family transcriptional regulator
VAHTSPRSSRAADAGIDASDDSLLVERILRPVRSGNTFEETVERLLRVVKLGVVLPGERLPAERTLAVRLGVSRATLRDAIAALRLAGYLESRRGRRGGTFVITDRRRPSALPGTLRPAADAEVDDALDLRYALETGAAEIAAGRPFDRPTRDQLSGLYEACCAAGPATYRSADSRLHLAIAELSGSPSLATAVADARIRVNDMLDAVPLLPRNLEHSNGQHGNLVAAILGGDAAAARSAMAEHLDGTAALIRGFVG